jgi:hypothetical protein
MAAKSLLRHSNVQTTAARYIKSVPEDAPRAVEKIDALLLRRRRCNEPMVKRGVHQLYTAPAFTTPQVIENLEPRPGIEPGTYGLRNRRSTS